MRSLHDLWPSTVQYEGASIGEEVILQYRHRRNQSGELTDMAR